MMAFIPILLEVGLWGIKTFFVGSDRKRKAKKAYIAYWEQRLTAQTGPIENREMEGAQKAAFKERDAAREKVLAKVLAIKKREEAAA